MVRELREAWGPAAKGFEVAVADLGGFVGSVVVKHCRPKLTKRELEQALLSMPITSELKYAYYVRKVCTAS